MNIKNIKIYSIHNKIHFTIDSEIEEGLYEYMTMQFSDFISDCSDMGQIKKKITFQIKNKISTGDECKNIIQDKQSIFTRKGNWFIWKHRGEKIILNGETELVSQTHVKITPYFDKMKCNLIVDLILRLQLIKKSIVLIHSAAVSRNGQATLMSAWKASGKTKFCLKLIEQGYDFLADDKVWVGADSTVYSYPRYVVIKNNNIQEFKSKFNRVYVLYSNFVYKIFKNEIFNQKYFKFILKNLQIRPKYFKVNELYPTVKTIQVSTLKNINFLIKGIGIEFNRVHFAHMVSDINNYEWNNEILDIASAHDYLFPDSNSWYDEVLMLIKDEKDIIHEIILKDDILCSSVNIQNDSELFDSKNNT
jgi:hypothetical protein